MMEQLFAINTITFHEVRYDIIMLKIEQLFVFLIRICYDIPMLKYLRNIIVKLASDKEKDKGKAANEGTEQRQQTKVMREAGRKQSNKGSREGRNDIPYQGEYLHIYLDQSHLLSV